jgi:hypothetical protein
MRHVGRRARVDAVSANVALPAALRRLRFQEHGAAMVDRQHSVALQ